MEALEERDDSNGQVSGTKIKELLESFQGEILTGVEERLQAIKDSGFLPQQHKQNVVFHDPVQGEIPTFCSGKYFAFCYGEDGETDRRFWQVPNGFSFPKVNLRTGWTFWIKGMPEYADKEADGAFTAHPISPFRHFKAKMLPKKVKNAFLVNWKPVFTIMDGVLKEENEEDIIKWSPSEVEESLVAGLELLKGRASYAFEKPRHERWGVGTWSKYVQPSEIRKHGSEADKQALLPPPSGLSQRNRQARVSKGRKREKKTVNCYPRRLLAQTTNAESSVFCDSPGDTPAPPASPTRAQNQEACRQARGSRAGSVRRSRRTKARATPSRQRNTQKNTPPPLSL